MTADFTAFADPHILCLDLRSGNIQLHERTVDDFQFADSAITDIHLAQFTVLYP
jgi:hypothetical protein